MQGNTGWIPIHYKLYTGEYRVDTDLLLIIYRGIQGGYRSIINYIQGNTGWIPIYYKLLYKGIQGGYRSIINYYTEE